MWRIVFNKLSKTTTPIVEENLLRKSIYPLYFATPAANVLLTPQPTHSPTTHRRNANGGCGCYAPGTTCEKSDTIRESGRKTYKLDVDPAYVIPSTSQSTASPVAPTLAPTELSDVVTDDESCDLVDDKSCKKWVGNKKGKKMKKKCKKNLKKKNKKKKVFVWCPVTCGEKAGLGKCAFMKKKNKNKKN